MKDFYEVLGVSRGSSSDEIKKAYRSLARNHHPDVDKSPGAEARFKEINEAYQVLSDSKRKEIYDQVGHEAFKKGAQGSGGFPGGDAQGGNWGPFSYSYSSREGGFSDFDPLEIFESVFGSRGFRERARGEDLNYVLDVDFYEAVSGGERLVEINGQTLHVKIPPGARTGTKIKFVGLGDRARSRDGKDLPPGDLYITIRSGSHPEFTRDGDDIYSEKTLSFTELSLGDNIDIKTVQGIVKLKIPSGTQPGSDFRIKGKGVKSRFGAGDHYVKILLKVPRNPSGREKILLEELKKLGV